MILKLPFVVVGDIESTSVKPFFACRLLTLSTNTASSIASLDKNAESNFYASDTLAMFSLPMMRDPL